MLLDRLKTMRWQENSFSEADVENLDARGKNKEVNYGAMATPATPAAIAHTPARFALTLTHKQTHGHACQYKFCTCACTRFVFFLCCCRGGARPSRD
jgi:hypothetical protein